MSLQEKINENLKGAMKNKEADTVSVLRMLNTALMNYSVAQEKKGKPLSDEEVMPIIAKEIKQRKDSISEYEKGGREDLADQEKVELAILEAYMPDQMPEEEVKKVVEEIIASAGEGVNIGVIMGQAMGKLKGKTDGNIVRKIVEELIK